jgi:transcriptional regulator of acetoin/glycerol metabolism
MRGKIVQADVGTLFLDEIGDMPLQLQTRLLRVLAEKEILPLGTEKPIPVDVQIVCATHRNLLDLVIEGRFREDLYYRLNGMKLVLSALRERADKASLIGHILDRLAMDADRAGVTLEHEALQALLAYAWPGNLRQLTNVLRAALALNDDNLITLDDIPSDIDSPDRRNLIAPALDVLNDASTHAAAPDANAPQCQNGNNGDEITSLVNALKQNKWNVTRAAGMLGICRATVYRKMLKFRIIEPNGRE